MKEILCVPRNGVIFFFLSFFFLPIWYESTDFTRFPLPSVFECGGERERERRRVREQLVGSLIFYNTLVYRESDIIIKNINFSGESI